jgi:tetratricopeptide (TPR) repeat protein
MDNLEEAQHYLTFIIKNDPSDQKGIQLLKKVREIAGLKKQSLEDPHNIEVTNALASFYLYLGNMETARKYIDKSLAINAYDIESTKLLKDLNRLKSTKDLKNSN